jgi:protoporphyrinogen/coproporphyrinogen III oxidase
MAATKRVVVIGAGISGLACAYQLKRRGIGVRLLESAERTGGLIGTVEKDGFLFESGAQSFQGTTVLLDLIQDLGLDGELLRANPRAARYVLRGGRLQEIPMSPQGLIGSSLLGAGSRWKILSEPFRRTKRPSEDESVADFVRRKFGHEILEYLVSPFVSGVYAGDPEKLSLRAAFPTLDEWEREFGSVLRGAIKSRSPKEERKGPPPLCSFRCGLATLMQALSKELGESLQPGGHVESLNRTAPVGAGGYEIRLTRDGRNESLTASAVVLATPAYVAGQVAQPVSPSLAQTLSGIPYAPVAVIAAGYYARQLAQPLVGFGFLVPRSEKVRTLGTVWNSSLFAGRAPEGCVAMTSFIGGATDPETVEKPEDTIAAITHDENGRILGISGPPFVSVVWKYGKALPQYNLGHGHVVEAIRDGERAIPGLFFSGNYLEGPAIGKCVEQGFRTAEAARAYVETLS